MPNVLTTGTWSIRHKRIGIGWRVSPIEHSSESSESIYVMGLDLITEYTKISDVI